MLQMLFDGRYVIILMGAFAVFTGSLYNEMFSVPTGVYVFGGFAVCVRWMCWEVKLRVSVFALILRTDFFGTNWKFEDGEDKATRQDDHYVYPWGVDPVRVWFAVLAVFLCVRVLTCEQAWKGAKNELLFYNSFKMKLSVILGVTHVRLAASLSCAASSFGRVPDSNVDGRWYPVERFECFPLQKVGQHLV